MKKRSSSQSSNGQFLTQVWCNLPSVVATRFKSCDTTRVYVTATSRDSSSTVTTSPTRTTQSKSSARSTSSTLKVQKPSDQVIPSRTILETNVPMTTRTTTTTTTTTARTTTITADMNGFASLGETVSRTLALSTPSATDSVPGSTSSASVSSLDPYARYPILSSTTSAPLSNSTATPSGAGDSVYQGQAVAGQVDDQTLAIGLGVGIGAAALLGLLVFIAYYQYKRRSQPPLALPGGERISTHWRSQSFLAAITAVVTNLPRTPSQRSKASSTPSILSDNDRRPLRQSTTGVPMRPPTSL